MKGGGSAAAKGGSPAVKGGSAAAKGGGGQEEGGSAKEKGGGSSTAKGGGGQEKSKLCSERRSRRSRHQRYKTFDDRMEDLKRYKEKHGHANVSIFEDKSLAQFCAKSKCRKKQLTKERILAFDAIDFNWTTQEYATRSFDKRIDDLEENKHLHGHLSLKKHKDNSLNKWCASVRHSLRHVKKDGTRKLTVEHTSRFDALGFQW